MFHNADMQAKDIQTFCRLDMAGEESLKMAITKLGFSARTDNRILKIGPAIADLTHTSTIRPEHIPEAIQYRSLDGRLWQSPRR